MTRRILIVVGAVAFVLNLLWSAPAGILYAWFGPKSDVVAAAGISGSLGRGHMAALLVRGQPALENLSWHWQPAWLLLGRIRFDIEGGGSDLQIHGSLQDSFGGISLRNAVINGNLSKLISISPLVFAPVSGMVDAQIERARWHRGALAELEGVINAQRVHWTLAQPPFLLGDYVAHIATGDDAINAEVTTQSGPLSISGEAHLVTASGTYSLDLLLHSEGASSNPLLLNLLHSLGNPDAQGHYHIHSGGTLSASTSPPGPQSDSSATDRPQAASAPIPATPAPTAAPSFGPAQTPAGSAPNRPTLSALPQPPTDANPAAGAAPPPPPPPADNPPGAAGGPPPPDNRPLFRQDARGRTMRSPEGGD